MQNHQQKALGRAAKTLVILLQFDSDGAAESGMAVPMMLIRDDRHWV
jgi:hypothetical protein